MAGHEQKPDRAKPRAVPHSVEAEQGIVGAVLVREAALYEASQYVVATDFYTAAHAKTFAAMLRLSAAGSPIDLVTLSNELRAQGDLAAVGGSSALAEVSERVPTSAHVGAYARTVRMLSIRRKLIANAGELALRAAEDSDLDGVTDILSGLVTTDLRVDPVPTMAELVAESVQRIEDVSNGKRDASVSTGLANFDSLVGGLPVGWQSVWFARPSLGKSSLLRTVFHDMLRRGERVGLIDLEMRREGVTRSLLSRETGIPAKRLRMGRIGTDEWALIVEAQERMAAYPLDLHDGDNRWGVIKLAIRRMADAGCQLVVVDYLSKVEPERVTGNMYQDTGRIAYEAHDLAHRLGVHIAIVVQQTREAPKEKDKRPKMYHLRESGKIEEAADLIAGLYRPAEFDANEPADLVELWILKAKDAPRGKVDLRFFPETMEFADWDATQKGLFA